MSVYHDHFGHAYRRKFVVVDEMEDGMIACGVYDDYNTAVGYVMTSIWEFKDSYKRDGDIFEIGEMEDGENGDFIRIRFKSVYWDKPCEETYHILYYDERDRALDKPKEKKVEKT